MRILTTDITTIKCKLYHDCTFLHIFVYLLQTHLHNYTDQTLFLYTWLPFPQQITVTFMHCNNLDELMILDLIAEVHETVEAVFPDLN